MTVKEMGLVIVRAHRPFLPTTRLLHALAALNSLAIFYIHSVRGCG